MRFRRSELFFSAYFIYVAVVAIFRPIDPAVRTLILTLNPALILWFCIFAWANKQRGFLMLDHVRDWYPLPLILLAFREMGWLALPHTSRAFEEFWVRWDRILLNDWGLRAVIESAGPLFPSVLELAYMLVYVMPVVTVAVFYHFHARERLDDAYSILLFGTLTTYALYPFFPSDPPRTVYPTADLPATSLLRDLNLFLVGGYGIHTSVFPSGHAAAAFSSAFAVRMLLPEHPWAGRLFLLLAVLISIATVYGRYHFAIDTLAGFGMALLSVAVSRFWRKPQ
jgi:membrane-associated phospholipid phosphatase